LETGKILTTTGTGKNYFPGQFRTFSDTRIQKPFARVLLMHFFPRVPKGANSRHRSIPLFKGNVPRGA
jgi:hypothetical protein